MAVLGGYYSDMRTVTVYPGQTTGYYPSLRPSPNPPVAPGAIFVQSTPAGASIYVSGVYYGTTPITVHNLNPGTYSVMAALNGYSSTTQLVTVSSGQTAGYYPALQPSPNPSPVGAIFAQSTPDGASMYLNSQYYGVSPVTITNLAPATYVMKATLNGYSDDTQRITVSAGHTSFYTPTFYPSPPPIGSGQGIIAVYGNVEGAQVYFDNTYEGNITNGVLFVTVYTTATPVQTYRVENTGYIPYTGAVTQWPSSGQTVAIHASLVPAPAPTTHTPLPVIVTIGALLGVGALIVRTENQRKSQ